MGIETALVIGAVAAIAGTTATVENNAQQRRLAGQAKDRATSDQNNARRKQMDDVARNEQQTAMEMLRQKQRGQYAGSQGRAGTMLTGNQQAPTQTLGAPTAGKTLLGA